jgi:hypothetical protein
MNNTKITIHLVEILDSQGVIAPFGHVAPPRAAEIGACEQWMSHARKKNKCNLRTFVVISFA